MINENIIPYAVIGNVILYHGDCLEIMPKLNMKFDACITDPPYGTTACKWDSIIPFEPMWNELKKLIKSNGAICLFGQQPFSSYLRCSNIPMYRYDWIWKKNRGVNFAQAPYMPLKKHELISVFSQATIAQNSKNRMIYYPQGIIPCHKIMSGKDSNDHRPTKSKQQDYIQQNTNYPECILYFAGEIGLHPTQKPVALIEYLVKTYTNENEYVLDFTAGSGTTGVACLDLNRKCVLIEKEEKYCEIIVKRLQEKNQEVSERLF